MPSTQVQPGCLQVNPIAALHAQLTAAFQLERSLQQSQNSIAAVTQKMMANTPTTIATFHHTCRCGRSSGERTGQEALR